MCNTIIFAVDVIVHASMRSIRLVLRRWNVSKEEFQKVSDKRD